jgi:hypothetical protein
LSRYVLISRRVLNQISASVPGVLHVIMPLIVRIGWIGVAVAVALGLLWAVATTSKLVPLPKAEISSHSMR